MSDLRLDVTRQLRLPSISVGKQLLLVVEQLLVVDSRVFVVRPLHDCIDWTRVLAKAAIDALGHIDIVASGSSGPVRSWLALNRDGVGGTGSSAQFAGNASALYQDNRSSPVG